MAQADTDLESTVLEAMDPLLGALVGGRYRVDQQLAAGGFGRIYHAVDVMLNREVALKVLHRELVADPTIVLRFQREAAALACLHDPHTVLAYGSGEAADGTPYIVMELLSGESLYERFRVNGPMRWQRVVAIARGVCSSLVEAHGLGMVHRDLKPSNIHLESRGSDPDYVKVIDFGIAKIAQASEQGEDDDITLIGQMIGTFDYMPAEQMIGGTCTARSDIFTLGIVMYELIAGRRPYGNATNPATMLASLLSETPAPLAGIPTELARIITRCIQREPNDRFADAGELASELDGIVTDEDTTLQHELFDAKTWINTMPATPRTTLPGVAIPRPSRPLIRGDSPRLASGTSPITNEMAIVDRPISASPIYPTIRAGGTSFVVWVAILVALALVGAVIALI